jgi:GT2 family glycosyltransferase
VSSKEIKGDCGFVSIIMVTYNSVNKLHEFFDEVLKSLVNLDYDNYAIVIVDNNSGDSTINHVKEMLRDPEMKGRVLIIKLRENKGLPYAYNVGAIMATRVFPETMYLLFMNDDVILSKELLNVLVRSLRESCDVIQPVIIHMNGHKEVGFGIGITGYVKPLNCKEIDCSTRFTRVPVISGAVFMVKKDAFFDIGMFDGKIFWGYDDVDFCWRLHKHGYTTCIAMETHAIHYGSATWGRENPIKYYYNTRNHIYMFYKNHYFMYALLLTPVLLLEILRLFLWKISRRDLESIKAILLGIIDGIRMAPLALMYSLTHKYSNSQFVKFDLAVDLELILGGLYSRLKEGK